MIVSYMGGDVKLLALIILKFILKGAKKNCHCCLKRVGDVDSRVWSISHGGRGLLQAHSDLLASYAIVVNPAATIGQPK